MNNKLTHIAADKGLDQVMVNFLVRAMLNPNNKDFYIKNLTLHNIAEMFTAMNNRGHDISDVFWTAYDIAEGTYLQQKYLERKANEEQDLVQECLDACVAKQNNVTYCPECGCLDFVPGVKCPNCDYVD